MQELRQVLNIVHPAIAQEHTTTLFNEKLLSATTFMKTAEDANAKQLYMGYGLSATQADRCITAFRPGTTGKSFYPLLPHQISMALVKRCRMILKKN